MVQLKKLWGDESEPPINDDDNDDDAIAYGPQALDIYENNDKDEENPRLLLRILPNLQGDFLQSARTQPEAAKFAKSLGGRLPSLEELMYLADARGTGLKDIQKESLWSNEVLLPVKRGKNRKGRKFTEYKTYNPETGKTKERSREDERAFIVVCTP